MQEIIEDQCPVCYRTFNPDVLQRHAKICAKVNTKVRKPMDIRKKRLEGTDIVTIPTKNTARIEDKPKKISWKEKHEEFIRNIRYARQAKAAEERGEVVAPPPPSQRPADHVECPTCGRSFNPNSAKRHIDFCSEQAKRRPHNKKLTAEAASRREKMMSFKSTLDRRKEQTRTVNNQYAPGNYATPHSRNLRNLAGPAPPGKQHAPQDNHSYQDHEDMGFARANTQIPRDRTTTSRNNRNVSSAKNDPRRVINHVTSPARDTHMTSYRGAGNLPGSRMPPFCYECGHKYPTQTAKFCCECGTKRLSND